MHIVDYSDPAILIAVCWGHGNLVRSHSQPFVLKLINLNKFHQIALHNGSEDILANILKSYRFVLYIFGLYTDGSSILVCIVMSGMVISY